MPGISIYIGGCITDNREIIDTVQRMQDFIETHIHEKITLRLLADAAGYSPWHAARLFKEITGRTPFDYIRNLRLSRAAEKLITDEGRIVDVALEFVFDSHEGFTRAFSRQFGVSPKAYARNQRPDRLFIPLSAREYYLKLIKGDISMAETGKTSTVFVQVIDRPKRKFIYKPAARATHYFEYCEEVGCEIWDALTQVKDALYEPIGVWMPENLRKPGMSEYFQGVEMAADYDGPVPDGCEIMELPACKVMIFQGPTYDDEIFEQAIGEMFELMDNYNPDIYGFKWAPEDGPRFQLAPEGYRGYIEGRPVREINK